MKTKHKFIISCVVLVLVLALLSFTCLTTIPAFAFIEQSVETREIVTQMTSYETISQNQRLYNATTYHIENNKDKDLKVFDTKTLKDFDGNNYTLFELNPVGYIIYHNDSGRYVEYSENSVLPYKNHSCNLYYGGPKQYYCLSENYLTHTVRPEMSFEITIEQEQMLVESSRELASRLNEQPITSTLDYIRGKKITIPPEIKSVMQSVSARSATPNLSMAEFFTKLKYENEIGYCEVNKNGVCGYIAANMIIGYCHFAYDFGLIYDSGYVDFYNQTMNGSGLTKLLISYAGYDPNGEITVPGTVAQDIYNVMIKFFERFAQPQVNWTLKWNLFDIDGVNTLKKGFPVMLFGNFPNIVDSGKGNHVVRKLWILEFGRSISRTLWLASFLWNKYE